MIERLFCEVKIKKIFYLFNRWIWARAYSITAEPCISLMRSIVYHQRLAVVYHHCERGYSLRLMIYTFGDEIHANAWWYTIAFAMDKKIRQVETCRIFWRRQPDLNWWSGCCRPTPYRLAMSPCSPSRARTYNPTVNSRVLYHWAIEDYFLGLWNPQNWIQ